MAGNLPSISQDALVGGEASLPACSQLPSLPLEQMPKGETQGRGFSGSLHAGLEGEGMCQSSCFTSAVIGDDIR